MHQKFQSWIPSNIQHMGEFMLENSPSIVNTRRLTDKVTHLFDEIFNDCFRVREGKKRNFNDGITSYEPFTVFCAVTAN